jgi:23S rRNA pseudouridine2605 synthase
MSLERVQKILAHAGIASRRKCEELIAGGRVTVNGKVAKLGDQADAQRDEIKVDGRPLPASERKIYIMVNKPRDVIADEDDTGEGRRTVRDMIDVEGHLYPVGRLDKQSIGLMLMTNDGDLAHKLTHPRYQHEKVYRVKVEGNPKKETLVAWRRGVDLEDGRTAPARVNVTERLDDSTWLEVVLTEGRKRQIRRVAAQLGHPVLHLTRTQIGPLKLGDLPLGQWRYLTPSEVRSLKRYTSRDDRPQPKRDGRGRVHRRRV